MNLFVPGNPIPQGSKRAFLRKGSNVPVIVDANRIGLAQWRAQIAAYAMDKRQQDGVPTFTGPVAVRLEFWLKRPLDHYLPVNSKRDHPVVKQGSLIYPPTAPDLDKLVRAVFDAFTDASVWTDDAQVVKVVATKLYSDSFDPDGPQPGVMAFVQSWGGK